MGDFNGQRYYGFSLQNDPALTTTVRNFEFRYARPEHLERAIQRVQLTNNTDVKQKKSHLLSKYCKLNKPRKDKSPFKPRDVDVETQMSYSKVVKTRELSEDEIEELVYKATSEMALGETDKNNINANASGFNVARYSPIDSNISDSDDANTDEQVHTPTNKSRVACEDNNDKLNPDDLQQLPDLFHNENNEQCTPKSQYETVVVEEYRKPTPQWVEVVEGAAQSFLVVNEVIAPHELKNMHSQPQESYKNTVKVAKTQTKIAGDDMKTYGQHMMMSDLEMQNYFMQQQQYFVEDSDLEYELLNRADYAKYCQPRPKEDELGSVSNEDGGTAHFIEIEPRIPKMNLSFLKNASPMRYTDYTDDHAEEGTKVETKHESKTANTKKPPKEKESKVKNGGTVAKKKQPKTEQKTSPQRGRANNSATPSRNPSPRSRYSKMIEQSTAGTSNSRMVKSPSPRQSMSMREAPYAVNTPRPSSARNRKNPKSLEELKAEKIAIFQRITSAQERIIELLDKLKMNLLETNLPDNSFEKTKRQKNAFEFSVRFSRNFLYPLKGMIEDLKNTPIDLLNSACSNDASNRLGNTYALLLQALQKYQKQLRYFLLDQVPQKLNVLIEMIYTVNGLCLNNGILDQNDPITDCLQDRCAKFLTFLENMHEERFMTARENYRKLKYNRRTQSNYDLKMFMNDLNMYEPKLVPKETQKRKSRKNMAKRISSSTTENSSKLMVNKNEDVATQIEGMPCYTDARSSMPTLVPSSEELMALDPNQRSTNQALLEALQSVTKEQMRTVLKPILETLGSSLDKTRNSELIETLLSIFSTMMPDESQRQRDQKKSKSKRSRLHSSRDNLESSSRNSIQQCPSVPSKVTRQTKPALPGRKAFESQANHSTPDESKMMTSHNNAKHRRSQSTANGNGSPAKMTSANQNCGDTNSSAHDCSDGPDNHYDQIKSSRQMETLFDNYKQRRHRRRAADSDKSGSDSYFSDSSSRPDSDAEQVTGKPRGKSDWMPKSESNEVHVIPKINQDSKILPIDRQHSEKKPIVQKLVTTSTKQAVKSAKTRTSQTSKENSRTGHHRAAPTSARPSQKSSFLKKKRNPLLPPPPVPTVTPDSSARSRKDPATKLTHAQTKKISKHVSSPSSYTDDFDDRSSMLSKQDQTDHTGEIPFSQSFENADNAGVHCPDHASKMNFSQKILYTNKSPYEGNIKSNPAQQCLPQRKGEDDNGDESDQKHRSNVQIDPKIVEHRFLSQNSPHVDSDESIELPKKLSSEIESSSQKDDDECSEKVEEEAQLSPEKIGDISTTPPDFGVDSFVRERDRFLSLAKNSRFYENPNYKEPWKTFSQISKRIVNDVVNIVENDFTTGVSKFIEDFIQAETKT